MVRGLVSETARLLGNGVGGTLVDAGAAVDAGIGVDDSDVIHGDGVLGADVGAGSATDTIVSTYLNYHRYTSSLKQEFRIRMFFRKPYRRISFEPTLNKWARVLFNTRRTISL